MSELAMTQDPREMMKFLHDNEMKSFSSECIDRGELPDKLPGKFTEKFPDKTSISDYLSKERHGSSPFENQNGYTLKKDKLALRQLKSDKHLKQADLVVVIMGPTGAGKSRLIKEATGYNTGVSDSLQSGTSRVEAYHFLHQDQHVALVDTPGFDDTNRPNAAVFRELAAWLACRYKEQTRLTAIIYMQPITVTRVSGSILTNFDVMKRMLGVQNFPYLTLVTSMWDTIDLKVGEGREQELRNDFWSDIIKTGANVSRFQGNQESAFTVLETVKKDSDLSLTIQQEIIDGGYTLDNTTAGTYLEIEMLKLINENFKENYDLEDVTRTLNQIAARRELRAAWNYEKLWFESRDPEPVLDPSIYRALEQDKFRLVELRAGSGSDPLEVSIAIRSLSQPPKYSALSYAVGKNQKPIQIKLRTDHSIIQTEIGENLHTALMQLRRPSLDILMWIDAFSINTDNHKERAQQIRKLSVIFSRAENVCIWLGPAVKGSENDRAMIFANHILDLTRLENALADKARIPDFLLVAKLMASPWFRRRWCVQEILMAKNSTVHCGSHVMAWSDFVDVATLLQTRWRDVQDNIDPSVTHVAGDIHLVDAMALIETMHTMIRKSRNGDIMERLLDLEILLSRLATYEVTMVLDTIYAIYDLCRDLFGTDKLRVDYSIPPRELFTDVTSMIAKSTGSLDIICRPWAPLIGLPTWIPTVARLPYKRRKDDFQFDRQGGEILVNMPGTHRYQACGARSAKGNVEFSKGDMPILRSRGTCLGVIEEVAGECLNGIIPEAWMKMCQWEDLLEDRAPDVFWRTIVADQGAHGTRAPDWFRRACETAFRESRTAHVDTNAIYKTCKSSHVQEFLKKVQTISWSRKMARVAIDERNHILVSLGLKETPSQAICLCPAQTRVGDLICILYGCSVPVILRKQASFYDLIGESYFHGLMDGEALNPTSGHKAYHTEEFKLI